MASNLQYLNKRRRDNSEDDNETPRTHFKPDASSESITTTQCKQKPEPYPPGTFNVATGNESASSIDFEQPDEPISNQTRTTCYTNQNQSLPVIYTTSFSVEDEENVNSQEEMEVKPDGQPINAGQRDTECFDEQGRPLVTNIFYSNKPLPKFPAARHTETGTNPAPPRQVPRYKLHTQEDEKAYARNGPELPIRSFKDFEFDDDGESSFSGSSIASSVEPKQRYFKRQGVFEQFKFNIYNFPETRNLAVYQHRDKIINAIKQNRVVVVEGFTGCGKTTQVPQFILDDCVRNGNSCNIVVTQPRKIAAQSVANRVCIERGWNVGTVVGFQVGLETQTNVKETMLTYMTTGVLLQKLIHSKSMRKFSHVIIDEVHERDLDTDLLLLVIKKILLEDGNRNEAHVKIILMSATLNASKFSQYFRSSNEEDEIAEAPIIRIPSTSQANYPVEEIFLNDLMKEEEIRELAFSQDKAVLHDDMYDAAVRIIVGLDDVERREQFRKSQDPRMNPQYYQNFKLENRGSVLVFLPGMLEILRLKKKLEEEDNSRKSRENQGYNWNVIELHSSITSEEQSRAFKPAERNTRKIILSTNIAESSITVSDVVYVIDFCLTKSLTVDLKTNFTCLQLVWASTSECTQRKGRTGRVAPGKVYRLIPRQFFKNDLKFQSTPEMKRAGLEGVILRVKDFDKGCPKEILALSMDPPPLSGIERAVVNLKEVGGLKTYVTNSNGSLLYDACDGDMTFLGKVMSQLPIPHKCTRLIMLGHAFGVMKECIIIGAGLSEKSPFNSPLQQRLKAYMSKLNWARRTYSDCFAILHLYREWTSKFGDKSNTEIAEKSWARASFVQLNALREIKKLVEDIEGRIKTLGIEAVPYTLSDGRNDEKSKGLMLKISIAGAFYPNYFHRHRPNQDYLREKRREVNDHDLFSTVYYKGFLQDHNGTLYAKHIAQKLTLGYDMPMIGFDGQKVFATFESASDKIGPISKGVYRALKLRKLRDRTEIKVLHTRDDERAYLNQVERNRSIKGRTFNKCPALTNLPGVQQPAFHFTATHVVSPNQFWIVFSDEENKLNEISNEIRRYEEDEKLRKVLMIQMERTDVRPGCFCLAPFGDGAERQYFRARIRAVDGSEALIYFVDYGNSAWIKHWELRAFSEDLKKKKIQEIPCLAVECSLSEIKPSLMQGSVWTDDSVSKLKKMLTEERFLRKMKIDSIYKSVIYGDVFVTTREGAAALHLNEKLFSCGYADKVSQASDNQSNNREARSKFNIRIRRVDEILLSLNKAQIEEIKDIEYIDPPKGQRRVELKGPFSPLELEFSSLCQSSNSNAVNIDDGSVNSVILDHEPTAPASRMIIASDVSIHDNSQRISARETTMMPAIPGLMGLLSMIFAPTIELRLDGYKHHYTGVLCGLGPDPDPQYQNNAIYPDHDMEIVFDTEIDDQDIEAINRIRYHMNLILRGPVTRPSSHLEVVEEIFKLMKKPRTPLEREHWPVEMYAWGRINEDDIIPPKLTFEPRDIFLPHSTLKRIEGYSKDCVWTRSV